ncbi:MAG: hypothetical protein ACUVUC_03730 [Thermoguttaceae bacterium]
MARKILNRKELREQTEAAGQLLAEPDPSEQPPDQAGPLKRPPRRKVRIKPVKEVRLKAFWGVFTQSLNQVAQFEYSQREEAAKRAAELSESRKTPHFVQLVKRVIEQ